MFNINCNLNKSFILIFISLLVVITLVGCKANNYSSPTVSTVPPAGTESPALKSVDHDKEIYEWLVTKCDISNIVNPIGYDLDHDEALKIFSIKLRDNFNIPGEYEGASMQAEVYDFKNWEKAWHLELLGVDKEGYKWSDNLFINAITGEVAVGASGPREKGLEYAEQYPSSVSPYNNHISVEIIKFEINNYDSLMIKNNDEVSYIDLENTIYTNIEEAEWLAENLFAFSAHVNPSQGAYIMVNLDDGEVNEFYGIQFTWDYENNKLYYFQTAPHFGNANVADQIVDQMGNVIYTINLNELPRRLKVNNNIFAFYTEDKNLEGAGDSGHLYIGQLNMKNKFVLLNKFDLFLEHIDEITDKTIIYTHKGERFEINYK